MQKHPDQEAAQPEVPIKVERGSKPRARNIDPGVEDILREEAEREERARAQEDQRIETQPDLGLSDDLTEKAADETSGSRPDVTPEAEAIAVAATAGSRRDLLPDIEEINSTLRSANDRSADNEPIDVDPTVAAQKKRGFRLGLTTSLVAALVLILIYAYSPQIAQSIPQADPMLSRYVTQVDRGRLWLHNQLSTVHIWLEAREASQQSR